ncbi:MAG: ATP-binding cassette domain-containing protein [Rhodobiaceae bacterium]|nr:ATP-binding cassette domain-containing protein [Rhodobiaceae bacterium]
MSDTQIPVLNVEHLTMRFGGLVAIDDLSFQVVPGDITAIIGPNGAGKTTVFNCITGFYKPTEGMLTLRHASGKSFLLERMFDHQIASVAHVARTFQNIRLFGGMTVLENLLIAQHNTLMRASGFTIAGLFGAGGFRRAERKAIEKARHWLEQIDLVDRADDPASDLPYGAQRRLEIARAMCTDPVLLCLDEPAAGLNPRESAALNKLLIDIRGETDTSILLIEHDMSVVMEISDHVVVLDYGKKISDGTALQVRNDPAVIAAYLGVEDEEVGAIGATAKPASAKARGKPVAVRTKAPAQRTSRAPAKPAKPEKTSPPKKPTVAELKREEAAAAEKLARLPATASALDKANAVGSKPRSIPQPRSSGPDDLKRIKGIGPANEKKLNDLGIWHIDQIAKWDRPQVRWVGTYLAFPGRIDREDWVRQAHRLSQAGDTGILRKATVAKVARRRARGKGGKP